MANACAPQPSIWAAVWRSFGALPAWVKIWMVVILAPVNLASLAFLDRPSGAWIAALAIGGMALSWIALFYSRGFSKLVSAGHVFPWTPLVLLLIFARPEAAGAYGVYLTVLLVIDLISLAFDYNDARLWLRGDRTAVI
ncbi:hypothetical protein LPB72_06410 [Hydrogenophaga crassostreae]|uniref:Uncharacterized protein n=1 Tax=Hydrogenophaga crassostreae TaxID=1763535 RepID=A0A167IIY2_9BURK|nr:hypothetical protein [Hydrogenophaga crassostreae]AOW14168.1 hypothetical protein LPB072_16305 [Hydrogenophaga crassostreae]OAD42902.1 hypothetical protein LPB72_06410 [Hydrogenophaga crassostreae]